MTDKSPTPPDRPDPHLDPTDDTDEPAFDWMKPASAAKPTAQSTPNSPAKSTASPAPGSAAARRPKKTHSASDRPSYGRRSAGGRRLERRPSCDGRSGSRPQRRPAPQCRPAPKRRRPRPASRRAAPTARRPRPPPTAHLMQIRRVPLHRTLASPGHSSGTEQDDVERRNAERRTAEREQAAKTKPVLPRVMQVLLAVFYPRHPAGAGRPRRDQPPVPLGGIQPSGLPRRRLRLQHG